MALRRPELHDAARGVRLNRHDLRAALSNANVLAFLRTIREGESRQDDMAYRMRYGGIGSGPKYFESFDDHPRVFEMRPDGRRSSAAGAYQATATTWDEERAKWQFPDFSPGSQDEFAVARIVYRKALDAVRDGRLEEACRLCRSEWTSLPGGDEENAATRRARETYLKWGGFLSAAPVADPLAGENYGEAVTESTINPIPSADEQEARMAPLIPVAIAAIQAFGPQLLSLIPQFGSILGSGSDVQVRNVKLATAAVDAVVKATGSSNLQHAIENMQKDPELAKVGQIAAAEVLALVEVGGGIKAARENAAQYATGEWWRMLAVPQTWVALLLLGLVYMALGNVTGLFGFQGWTPELRSNVVFAIVGVAIGSVSGYYFGTSQGSQRKTDILANQEK